MTRIEYGGKTVNVPETWSDITVRDYEDAQLLPHATLREKIAVAARLCGVKDTLFLSWPAEIFGEVVDRLSFVWGDIDALPTPSVTIDGIKYVVVDRALTLGEWIDADEVQREGERIFSRLLAIVCRPAGETYDSDRNEERATMFEALSVDRIQGVVAFFLTSGERLKTRTDAFSKLAEALGRLPRNMKRSPLDGGGTKLSRTWRAVKYWILIGLLRYQLGRCSPSSNTKKTGGRRKKHSGRSKRT